MRVPAEIDQDLEALAIGPDALAKFAPKGVDGGPRHRASIAHRRGSQ